MLRAAWERQRDYLLASAMNVASGLRGFWMFERGIPDELRREPPVIFALEDAERVRAERDALLMRRRAWLSEHLPDLDDHTIRALTAHDDPGGHR